MNDTHTDASAPDYPDAYVSGHAEFLGLDFKTDPRALIPRLETEVLTREAGKLLRERTPDLVIDTGTGSGIIPVSLVRVYGYSGELLATDIDPEALALAGENAARHDVRMRTLRCDLLDSADIREAVARAGAVLFTANLPYVPERDARLVSADTVYEPRHALYSGEDGYDHIERYLREFREIAARHPDKPLALVMEADPSHTERMRATLADIGDARVFADYAGDMRFIRFTRLWRN